METSYPTSVEIHPADEALANDILRPLDAKKLEWQNLSMDKRKEFLKNIGPFFSRISCAYRVLTGYCQARG